MPTFNVWLKSTTDEQSRRVTVDAENEGEAREIAALLEQKYVDYSAHDDPAVDDVDDLLASCSVDKAGKVTGASPRARARWHMHHQSEPYQIKSVEEVV